MYEVLDIKRMNYEDLKTGASMRPGGAKMHVHFFGRVLGTSEESRLNLITPRAQLS